MSFLPSCSWKEIVASYISKINSNIYRPWRDDSIFWFKQWMFWIPKSCTPNVLRCQSRTGKLFYYQWPGFHQVIWEGLQIFFCKFFWFTTTSFFNLKLLNSKVINTFKVIKQFSRHSSSLDTETEATYDNYKSCHWKSSMLWFPGMTTNKKWRPAKDRAHTLSLVILLGT